MNSGYSSLRAVSNDVGGVILLWKNGNIILTEESTILEKNKLLLKEQRRKYLKKKCP